MILDDEFTIPLEDARFTFSEVTQQDYLALVESKDKRKEIEHVFSRLVKVEGIQRKNGDQVTVDEMRTLSLPWSFCSRLLDLYWKEVMSRLGLTKPEAETGKES